MKKIIFILLTVVIIGLACSSSAPANATPSSYQLTGTSIAATMNAILTPQPTWTPGPTWTPEPTKTPEKLAWTACKYFIEQKLNLSTFDAQDYNPDGVTNKDGGAFLVKIFYANQKSLYQCDLHRLENGDWQLSSIDLLK
jgi:hypothetical protein